MSNDTFGGGNDNEDRRRRRRRLRIENSENIGEHDDFDAAIENIEDTRSLLRERISELEAEKEEREKALKSFSDNLNKMWNDIMDPISCSEGSDSEDDNNRETEGTGETSTPDPIKCQPETAAKGSTKVQDIDTSSSSSSDDVDRDEKYSRKKRKRRIKKRKSDSGDQDRHLHPDTQKEASITQLDYIPSSSQKIEMSLSKRNSKMMYRKSLSRIMYEWATQQKEFKDEILLLKEEKFREESDIKKFAFFKIFEKNNEEHKEKLVDARKMRANEWNQLKQKKKRELKEKYKEELRLWIKNEKTKRLKQDYKKRKKEYKQLRKSYLCGREDEIFRDKQSALEAMTQQQSAIPNQATTTGTEEAITSTPIVQEASHRSAKRSAIPTKRAKMLR